MAQWLRALAALLEDPSSIPHTHMATHVCIVTHVVTHVLHQVQFPTPTYNTCCNTTTVCKSGSGGSGILTQTSRPTTKAHKKK